MVPNPAQQQHGMPIPAYLQHEDEDEHEDEHDEQRHSSAPAPASLPSETELVLLCLDYLRDLRRSYQHGPSPSGATTSTSGDAPPGSGGDLLREAEQLDGNWISLAIYALSRSFVGEDNGLRDAFACGRSGDAAGGGGCGNDAWFGPQRAAGRQSSPLLQIRVAPSASTGNEQKCVATTATNASAPETIAIPSSMADINREILRPDLPPSASAAASTGAANGSGSPGRSKASRLAAIKSGSASGSASASAAHSQNSCTALYPHDDAHPSNLHRFYALNGLGGGGTGGGEGGSDGGGAGGRPPLTLGELTAAGLAGLGARSRLEAERDMVRSELFGQFLTAVGQKGFFEGTTAAPMMSTANVDDDGADAGANEANAAQRKYEERYRKVVAKFRTKLAAKAAAAAAGADEAAAGGDRGAGGGWSVASGAGSRSVVSSAAAFAAARQQMARRQRRIAAATGVDVGPGPGSGMVGTATAAAAAAANAAPTTRSATTDASFSRTDLDEAEVLKSAGNAHMQKKEYEQAVDAYTSALKLCPNGPSSHVYFSNRAAALLSMKSFEEAIRDSERSLALQPDYAKAHARLGLAQFLLGRFDDAVEAYEAALRLDPDNKASRSYLEKARKKLAAQQIVEETKAAKDKNVATSVPPNKSAVESGRGPLAPPAATSATTGGSSPTKTREQIRIDEKEANRFKSKGNAAMAARDYDGAIATYTAALELSPDGASSHVFYSNRAAALCYLERYEEAEVDSETSIRLRPDYGKGWARLGLSRFFLHDYGAAVSAYQESLKYEPDNPASRSYLQKALRKLEEEGGGQ